MNNKVDGYEKQIDESMVELECRLSLKRGFTLKESLFLVQK